MASWFWLENGSWSPSAAVRDTYHLLQCRLIRRTHLVQSARWYWKRQRIAIAIGDPCMASVRRLRARKDLRPLSCQAVLHRLSRWSVPSVPRKSTCFTWRKTAFAQLSSLRNKPSSVTVALFNVQNKIALLLGVPGSAMHVDVISKMRVWSLKQRPDVTKDCRRHLWRYRSLVSLNRVIGSR